jgi:hypothetical protein
MVVKGGRGGICGSTSCTSLAYMWDEIYREGFMGEGKEVDDVGAQKQYHTSQYSI